MPNHVRFENDALLLEARILKLKILNKKVSLSKNQTRLIYSLLHKVNEKSLLISVLWPGQDPKTKENNYSQLLHNTRKLLIENEFPGDFIMTLPGYGVCLNTVFLEKKPSFIKDFNPSTQFFL